MKKVLSLLLALSAFLLTPTSAFAVCPICTVAVGAGLGLSRYFGIDDSVTGIWVGGMIVSLTLWTIDWLQKKNWKISNFLVLIFYILITYPPLYWANIIGHPFNTILGVDKLIFGSILGALAFLLGVLADKKVRQTKGKQLFNYQKVVFPVLSLAIFSLLLYFYGGYLYGFN